MNALSADAAILEMYTTFAEAVNAFAAFEATKANYFYCNSFSWSLGRLGGGKWPVLACQA